MILGTSVRHTNALMLDGELLANFGRYLQSGRAPRPCVCRPGKGTQKFDIS
jgi:hypothetical protein